MADIKDRITHHYAHGSLAKAIDDGLAILHATSEQPDVSLLGAVDEFHLGGRAATEMLAGWLDLSSDHSVIDVGAGLGGTARYLNSSYGCRVMGIDLTPEYIEVGRSLNALVGVGDHIDLRVGSALDMPFADASFDAATMLHVGMNIADKRALMMEVARVLKSGAPFGLYDVMRTGEGAVGYPVPWAADEATSFLETPDEYRTHLEAAGFEVVRSEPKGTMTLSFLDAMSARVASSGPPALGLHILLGPDARTKMGNVRAAVAADTIEPVMMLARRL